jgi:endonuclease/exonuclease/phosphatase family metal-dependent hydrolase
MGDFNCDPDAPELTPLRDHFQEACAVCGVSGDARFTFPAGPLGARTDDGWHGAIDHVWASHDIRITSAQVIIDETKASDHQPLVVEFELRV